MSSSDTLPRAIVCAAIRITFNDRTGTERELVVTGIRHFDTLMQNVIEIALDGGEPTDSNPDFLGKEQGFVDEGGVFHSRERAMEIAIRRGQVTEEKLREFGRVKLFSEHLY